MVLVCSFYHPSCIYAAMVLGVRVHGDSVKEVDVTLDDSFRAVLTRSSAQTCIYLVLDASITHVLQKYWQCGKAQ